MSEPLRACALSDLDPDGGLLRFDTDGRSIALVRLGDKVYALGDKCSHADVSLSEGEVDTDECALECPKHGSLFSLETGEPLSLPAVRAVPTYDVTIEGDDVMVVVS
jgi:3-phenylpropionate/trans-cinnamate dioxygenase ferredoxin subunit